MVPECCSCPYPSSTAQKDTLLFMPRLEGTFYMACDGALQAFELGAQTLQQLFLAVPQFHQLSLLLPN